MTKRMLKETSETLKVAEDILELPAHMRSEFTDMLLAQPDDMVTANQPSIQPGSKASLQGLKNWGIGQLSIKDYRNYLNKQNKVGLHLIIFILIVHFRYY